LPKRWQPRQLPRVARGSKSKSRTWKNYAPRSPHNPDIVLLDNMSPALVQQAVEHVRMNDPARNIRIEASGGITLANVRDFAEAGVDWISVGALTHSAPAVDLSFEIEPEVMCAAMSHHEPS
jgi:nicotinate-nucleotide pyrophosphorylase